MTTRHERYDAMFKTAAGKHIGEEPLFIVTGSRIGSWSALAQSEFLAGVNAATGSPFGSWVKAPSSAVERKDGEPSKLPMNFLVAVTTGDVYLLDYRQRLARFIKIKRELGRFPRMTLEVFATDRRITRRFGLHDPVGEQAVAFELYRNHPVTEEFTELVGARIVDSAEEIGST